VSSAGSMKTYKKPMEGVSSAGSWNLQIMW